jgi:hypothetical protein
MQTRYPPLAHAQPTQSLETTCVQQMRLIEEMGTILVKLAGFGVSPLGRGRKSTGPRRPPEVSSFGAKLWAQTASNQLQTCQERRPGERRRSLVLVNLAAITNQR